MLRHLKIVFVCILLFLSLLSCETSSEKRILVIVQENAPATEVVVEELIRQCGNKNIHADTSTSTSWIVEDSLQNYQALVLVGLSPDILDYRQQNDLERFVQAGGGLTVIDAYTDTVLNWPWYESLTHDRLEENSDPWRSHYDGGRVYFSRRKAN
ncbi:MAG: ThuA domain-containing protein [Cyclobacteriaceae bacterium]